MKTFGSLSYNEDTNNWVIICEPHVALRLKRIFSKVSKMEFGKHHLSNTPENCMELDWFLSRYPLYCDERDSRRLKKGVRGFNNRTLQREEILSGKFDFHQLEMALPPRDYQRIAAELWINNKFLLLGDDVGVGKTVSAICGLVNPATRPALVCTLPHLTRQWAAEISKFAPSLSSHILKFGYPYDIPRLKDGTLDVIICNYHKLNGWAETLAGKLKSIVFDEIQELRRNESQKYSAANHIAKSCEYRIGLSATPILGYGGEMVHVLNTLSPDAIGSVEEFKREWCGGGDAIGNPRAFGTYLRETGIMLRRTRKDVNREIPPISIISHQIESDASAFDSISGGAAELAKIILGEGSAKTGDKFHAAGEFDIMVRQATGIAKAPYVAEFVRMLVESGESVLVFAWHRTVYDILMEKLKDLHPVMYTGEESANQKNEAKRKFTEKISKVMLISLRSGAGLDGLQYCCRTCVFAELDWAFGVQHQCIGRIARDGQTDPVTAYFLMSDSGSDPVMADILGLKKEQLEGIINPEKLTMEKVGDTSQHVRRLAEAYLNASRGIGVEEDF